MSNHRFIFAFAAIFALSCTTSNAQGTLDDYNRAYSLSKTFTWQKVKGYIEDFRWMKDGQFAYRQDGTWHTGKLTNGDLTINTETYSNEDVAKLFEQMDSKRQQWRNRRGGEHRFTNKRHHERHWMETDDERNADPIPSPDSSMVAFIRNDNVWIAKPDGSEARALSNEGTLSHYFSSYIQWSPDGKYVAVNRIRPIDKRFVYYVESSPSDQLQPILHKQEYAKPGDELAQKTPYIFEVATGKVIKADDNLITNQYDLRGPEWRTDSKGVRFEYNQRGHKLYRIYEMPVDGDAVRTLVEEREEKYVRYSNYYRQNVHGDEQILWLGERDGWPHLFLFNVAKPEKPLQLTKGEWCVRQVQKVDEEKGYIYFTANGRNKDEDPYHIHYYRIGLDGKGLIDLTPENANHRAQFNEDFTALYDNYSTANTAPRYVVRSINSHTVETHEISQADISDLQAAGWVAPEIFVAPGRDGKTPMWGIIQRPTNFDPTKKYPVIEYIYSGPGDSYVPKSFQPYNFYTTALSDLGFIVVQLDAMGTSNRGKKFEEVCYKNLKDAGFPDRIEWIKAAATKYPYMDANNVGIYGCSAGGQESTAAVLFHGDFYKAAYSACGCHDNRMDKIWWNEQWMGYPVDSSYVACSNVENASKLDCPLMLVVGELDDNVDPASTMQVANALIKANKPFELVVVPGAHHTVGEAYGEHKRFDFFVKNLLGIDPPAWRDVKNK